MNTKITALTLAAVSAFAFTPKPAVAGHKEAAIVGGLIGGLIIGAAIADANDCDTRVVVAGHGGGYSHPGHGYWETVTYNVWIPGYWVMERTHYGHCHRRFVPGHYECRNERVWVTHNRSDRYDRHDDRRGGRHERDYSRGYGHDNERRDRDYRR